MAMLQKLLVIYSWAVIGVLLVFLWRIAYFFEKTSGQRVGYRLLLFPGLLLALGVIWHLVEGARLIGDPVADLALFFGGVFLVLFSHRLLESMTGER